MVELGMPDGRRNRNPRPRNHTPDDPKGAGIDKRFNKNRTKGGSFVANPGPVTSVGPDADIKPGQRDARFNTKRIAKTPKPVVSAPVKVSASVPAVPKTKSRSRKKKSDPASVA